MITARSLSWFAWFTFICCIQFSACFTWTKYPESITRVWNGSTVSLQWDYDLTAEEQSAADSYMDRIWSHGNATHLVDIANKHFNKGGNPPLKYIEYFNPHIIISSSEEAILIISDVTKQDEGLYKFTVQLPKLDFSVSLNTTLQVSVQPTLQCNSSVSVIIGEQATLSCSVTGDPTPNITWTKVSDPGKIISYNSTLVIDNVRRSDNGKYNVTAYNGRSASVIVDLNVLYPPVQTASGSSTTDVFEGSSASILCPVTGNPVPSIMWYKDKDTSIWIANRTTLVFTATHLNDSAWYTCSATNFLGNVTARVQLRVVFPTEKPVPNTSSSTTATKPTTKDLVQESTFYGTATVDKDCSERFDVEERFPSMACESVKNKGCTSGRAVGSRCGSVIVDFVLTFNQSVDDSAVLKALKEAARQNKFGDLKVDPDSIKVVKQISPTPTESKTKWWLVAVFAVLGLIIICGVVGAILFWLQKRRKRRKDTEDHSSASEEQPLNNYSIPTDENDYSQGNIRYAEAGPRSTEMADMSQHQGASSPAAVPDYEVVDKKGQKNDAKAAEQKPAVEPDKKKDGPDATYAQVDKSKKTKKKKAKPGEVLYADLGDLTQNQDMPQVSNSPQPLPPIKKPTPYVETHYADITQFLKGDAAQPDCNNGQDPATGTKEGTLAADTGETNSEPF